MRVVQHINRAADNTVTAERCPGFHRHLAGSRRLITVDQQHAFIDVRGAGVSVIAGQRQRTVTDFHQAAVVAADNTADGVIKMQITQRQFFIAQFDITRAGQRADRRCAVDCADIDLTAHQVFNDGVLCHRIVSKGHQSAVIHGGIAPAGIFFQRQGTVF